jgi:hypothetical protein
MSIHGKITSLEVFFLGKITSLEVFFLGKITSLEVKSHITS